MSSILTLSDISRELISTAHAKVRADYLKAIGSLYVPDDKKRPKHAGTCTFFRHRKGLFLVSAKHVFEHVCYKDIHILTESGLKSVVLEAQQTVPRSSDQADHVDILVGKLGEHQSAWSDQFQTIEIESLCANAFTEQSTSKLIGLLGFPHSRNKYNRYKDRFKVEPCLVTGPKRSELDLHKASPFRDVSHVFMKHDRRNAVSQYGNVQMAIKLQGMSGGLAFDMGILGKIPEIASGATRNPSPIAIITDFIPERQFVAAIRLSLVQRIIDQYPDELSKAPHSAPSPNMP